MPLSNLGASLRQRFFFPSSLNLEYFCNYMAEKQLAGLDFCASALLPAASYNPKIICLLSIAFHVGCFSLHAKETQASQSRV